MRNHQHKKPVAFVAGFVALVALAAFAVPAGATIVCPGGKKPPSPYCMNVLPVASTTAATNVTATSATLNGVAGPGVANGDPTMYAFQWGPSLPDFLTPSATVPSGPASSPVSARLTNLAPATTYHLRLIVSNSDGFTAGADVAFKTAPKPIKWVRVGHRVKHGKTFKVRVKLNTQATVTIALLRDGKTVRVDGKPVKFNEGSVSGTVNQEIEAPDKKGDYVVRVTARAPGIKQTVDKSLRVH